MQHKQVYRVDTFCPNAGMEPAPFDDGAEIVYIPEPTLNPFAPALKHITIY